MTKMTMGDYGETDATLHMTGAKISKSQIMNGRTDEEIRGKRSETAVAMRLKYGNDAEIIDP